MNAALVFAVCWTTLAFCLGALVGGIIRLGQAADAPDGTAGDLLADQPAEVLVSDEQVKQLERTWLL